MAEAAKETLALAKIQRDSTPVCEECNESMLRYGPALDTGKMGYMCDLCGWSWDDD